ncbi:MAG: hypothetical protein AAF321_07825, partial [Pseudomonadota bacterium]
MTPAASQPSGGAVATGAGLGAALVLSLAAVIILVSPQGLQAVFLLGGLLAAPAAFRRMALPLDLSVTGLLLALLAWAAFSLTWTEDAQRAAGLVGAALAVVLAALALARAADLDAVRHWGGLALVWGLGIAITLGVIDLLSNGAVQGLTRPKTIWMVYEVNRLSAVTALLVWPALFLARTTIGRAALLAGAVAMAWLGDSQTAVLSLLAG